MVRFGWAFVLLSWCLPRAALAQDGASLIAEAEAEVSAARAARRCNREARALTRALTRLRAESDPTEVEAASARVRSRRRVLGQCMFPVCIQLESPPGAEDDPVARVLESEVIREAGEGVFDPAAVARMIRTRRGAFRGCFAQQLRTNPTLAGRVRVSMLLEESGSVSGVQILENTTGSDELAACVLAVIEHLRFSPGPDGGSVTFSFSLDFAPPS